MDSPPNPALRPQGLRFWKHLCVFKHIFQAENTPMWGREGWLRGRGRSGGRRGHASDDPGGSPGHLSHPPQPRLGLSSSGLHHLVGASQNEAQEV